MAPVLKKILICVVLVLLIGGCAQTWQYDKVNYPTSASALQAARLDVRRALDGIEPKAKPHEFSARIVIPSRARIVDAGVIKTPTATQEQINYVADVLDYGFLGMADAVKIRKIFKSASVERKYDTTPFIRDPIYPRLFFVFLEVGSQVVESGMSVGRAYC